MSRLPLVQFASTVGDGTGDTNFGQNYSVTQGVGKIIPAYNELFILERVIIKLRDVGNNLGAGDFGAIGGGLTNGISILVKSQGSTLYNLTPLPIKSNADLRGYMYDAEPSNYNTDSIIGGRWTFEKFFKGGLELDGYLDQELWITHDDDLSGLTSLTYCFQGEKRTKSNVNTQ